LKTLILIRHAKSSWNEPGVFDVDRPLNRRGLHDAPLMGGRLADRLAAAGLALDAMLASSARRAAQTARMIADELAFAASSIDWRRELYLAAPRTMMDIIRLLPDEVRTAALVAHNPGITEMVNMLARVRIDNVPTCGVALLSLKQEGWDGLEAGGAELISFDYPKRLPA
jgi:phosphohistidine phosphatase